MHALQTQDWRYAAEVVERHGMAMLMHSEISTVYEWCAALPEQVMLANPMLCILQAWTLVLGYRRDNCRRVEEQLQMAERAAAAMSERYTANGKPVRYLSSTFVPEEGHCMSLFEARSAKIVQEVNEAANLPFTRIIEAVELNP